MLCGQKKPIEALIFLAGDKAHVIRRSGAKGGDLISPIFKYKTAHFGLSPVNIDNVLPTRRKGVKWSAN